MRNADAKRRSFLMQPLSWMKVEWIIYISCAFMGNHEQFAALVKKKCRLPRFIPNLEHAEALIAEAVNHEERDAGYSCRSPANCLAKTQSVRSHSLRAWRATE